MEIDISQVFTDEHRAALERLAAGGLTYEEFEEIRQEIPHPPNDLSAEQYLRIRKLEIESGLEVALTEATSLIFAVKIAHAVITGRISGRLASLNNLPDRMERLERIAQFEMGSEVAEVQRVLAEHSPLPTREILRVYRRVLDDHFEVLEKEFNLEKKRKERRDDLGNSDQSAPSELTNRGKLLAKICPLFRDAAPQIQKEVWSRLCHFTRKQWALFISEASPKRKQYSSVGDAVDGIARPLAKEIEKINGLTNMHSISIVSASPRHTKDLERVREVISILKASSILRKTSTLP